MPRWIYLLPPVYTWIHLCRGGFDLLSLVYVWIHLCRGGFMYLLSRLHFISCRVGFVSVAVGSSLVAVDLSLVPVDCYLLWRWTYPCFTLGAPENVLLHTHCTFLGMMGESGINYIVPDKACCMLRTYNAEVFWTEAPRPCRQAHRESQRVGH